MSGMDGALSAWLVLVPALTELGEERMTISRIACALIRGIEGIRVNFHLQSRKLIVVNKRG